MVYPGAMHTRFEHSLGVMHIATKMYDHIINKKRQYLISKLGFNDSGLDRDRKLVRLACLLHDIGHSPFSHAGEGLMDINPETEKPYKHEDYSSAIVSFQLKDVIEQHPQNENYRITVKEISDFLLGSVDLGRRLLWLSSVAEGCYQYVKEEYMWHKKIKIGQTLSLISAWGGIEMGIKFSERWNQYGVIAELAVKLKGVSPQFGKTVLQKRYTFFKKSMKFLAIMNMYFIIMDPTAEI
ncbi:MAG: HD domain-containing protein [Syntrophomonadaceae bacterium]|nr:HD domain-containing protein [Syntrophomonadaceae bacterium]